MPPPDTLGGRQATDSLQKKQPLAGKKGGPQKALFTIYSSIQPAGKENYPQTSTFSAYPNIKEENFGMERAYVQNAHGKRTLMDAPHIQSKKQKVQQSPISPLEAFGLPSDDGQKPTHISYAQLIGMAILTSEHKRLTLAQIYKWITDNISYYRTQETGWQNSIRHNLSLNKAFTKQERPKDDPGKGNYWIIVPGEEEKFLKDKAGKKSLMENAPVLAAPAGFATPALNVERPRSSGRSSARLRSSTPASIPTPVAQPTPATFIPIKPTPQHIPQPQVKLEQSSQPLLKPRVNAELSSDATIPASDADLEQFQPDDDAAEEDRSANAAATQPILSSPPAHMMQSSPPVPRRHRFQDDTPPPKIRFQRSSVQRPHSHRRNFASMDDSGFFSSVSSSALRSQKDRRQLPSEDGPRIKGGRAEDEIARLRGSSYDSPTKSSRHGSYSLGQGMNFGVPSSSPVRRGLAQDGHQMLPPLTPAIKLTAPPQPPPSVSPNTNLRLHRQRIRDMVGSPQRIDCHTEEMFPYSPAFNLHEPLFPDLETEFEMFIDTANLGIAANGSPMKQPIKRPSLSHAPYSTGMLRETAATNLRNNKSGTSTPKLNLSGTPQLAPSFESPSKRYNFGSPLKLLSPSLRLTSNDEGEYFGAEFLTDGIIEDPGMDLLQPFGKIGAKNPRQQIKRSFTSRF